jgi:hypothetical protein
MISNEKTNKLVSIYLFISDLYEKELKFSCQRFSNNANPDFTDAEILTVYLFCKKEEQKSKKKDMYNFIINYYLSWFPKIPSYQAFCNRLNLLNAAFKQLDVHLFSNFLPDDCDFDTSLVDSMPIMCSKGKNRIGKVATEIADKGYCSTKNVYYYGLKLHLLGFRRKGKLPFPEMIAISQASENDLNIFRNEFDNYLYNRTIYGDKIYYDIDYFKEREISNIYQMLTPIKLVKGEAECLRQRDKAYNDLFSKMVSTVRQPIEALFNWIIEKTDIQNAAKVRSTKALLTHVFGCIAAAFLSV